ncbi:MAG: hypothetical protein US29_C0022G0004 [candidate division WS6 bacterium GW2011_GWF1_36_8]|uniref:Fimbrial assembly family protein n=1 Tax=candidate division WS6 bacterium GW2011_GWF1_36_8 TaxID=1619098 RepID=A0A0G0HWT8_9BACT|nr:MAG: hypothetical protein US29_C0022G0004 [candidate division WS6 bacterium GW2011_GWF1_36_8]
MFKFGKQPQSIDFLQPSYSPTDIWSTAYIWLTNVGKYLLIGVEVLVLGVFFSRFILDRQDNDLKEEVNAKVTLLSNESWQKNAAVYENYQYLLSDIKLVKDRQVINSVKVSELISGIPSSLHLTSFGYSVNRISLRLTSNSLNSIKDYEASLKNNPNYSNVAFSIDKNKDEINVSVTFVILTE